MAVPACPSAVAAASRLTMWVVPGPSPNARLIQMAVRQMHPHLPRFAGGRERFA